MAPNDERSCLIVGDEIGSLRADGLGQSTGPLTVDEVLLRCYLG
jgi:hypothetical protein